jgi:hypothetical protein
MVGGRSPESSRSVAKTLVSVLRHVRRVEFPRLGHMGPVTGSQAVNNAVAVFVAVGRCS